MSSLDITADDVLAPRSNIEAPERNRAVNWLKEILSQVDSMPSSEILKLAQEQGFKPDTLAKAKKEIGVKCFPMFDDEGNRSWHWRLPREGKNRLPSLSEALKNMPKMPVLH